MSRRKRQASTFNLSFLDIMSCGFGAVILVFLIIDHSIELQIKSMTAEVLSEVNLLEDDIKEGETGLVTLRNSIASQELEIVRAEGRANSVSEELSQYESLIASIEQTSVADSRELELLKAEINQLEVSVQKLREAAETDSGESTREFQGEGNRQYLTGIKLGGQRILILFDISASMLAPELVNIIRLRNMNLERQITARKWVQALDTFDWLTAQLPTGSRYQVITFNTEANFVLPDTRGEWLEIVDTAQVTEISEYLRSTAPSGGSSLWHGFQAIGALTVLPDNIFLITDGLPTQGEIKTRKTKISGPERLRLYRDALDQLPKGIPVNVVLAPMEGDPLAASEYWRLAQNTGGSFMAPARDWP